MTTICCVCQKTKGQKGWVKKRVGRNNRLSHGYCPECYRQTMDMICNDFQRKGEQQNACTVPK